MLSKSLFPSLIKQVAAYLNFQSLTRWDILIITHCSVGTVLISMCSAFWEPNNFYKRKGYISKTSCFFLLLFSTTANKLLASLSLKTLTETFSQFLGVTKCWRHCSFWLLAQTKTLLVLKQLIKVKMMNHSSVETVLNVTCTKLITGTF